MYRQRIPRYLCSFDLDKQSKSYDAVVVGAGIAGLFAALTLDAHQKILLIAKGDLRDCNSNLAQGGIAMTLDGDVESHVEDTLNAGSHFNDLKVVRQMIEMSPSVFETLIQYNTAFDKNEDGSVSMTAEGGHTKRRIVHCKDLTGEGVMTALLEELKLRNNIEVKTHAMGIDVITTFDNSKVVGFNYVTEGAAAVTTVKTANVILATGGIGGLFKETTNSSVVTGDGLAMALRAGISSKDAEFIQFHPTAMALKSGGYFLISEAVRGEGGHLINEMGERFMDGLHPMRELAPRDVVAKAINDQKLQGHDVYVDVRHFESGRFSSRFPNIYKACLDNGIDPLEELIPVTPVEHYYMGGVKADLNGKTSCEGLYVTGEAAGTGFHGANRLASNSLLECLTLSSRIVAQMNQKTKTDNFGEFEGHDTEIVDEIHYKLQVSATLEELEMLGEEIKTQFAKVFTIIRSHSRLRAAQGQFDKWLEQLMSTSHPACENVNLDEAKCEWIKLVNALMVGSEICRHALERKKSLGGFMLEEE